MKLLSALLYLVNLHKCWFGHRNIKYCVVKVYKDKAIPLQAWTGPEGSRRFRFPDFKTIDT
jgi:hypothetical protein